jgi:hypothetical protein
MALSGHLYEPPRPVRIRPQRGQPASVRTRGPSMAYSLRSGDWGFLRTWSEPGGFPEFKPPGPLLLLCQQVLAFQAEAKPSASPGAQSLQLREVVSPTLHALHQHGLSGEYGIPRELPGDSLVSTLISRLPEAIAGL